MKILFVERLNDLMRAENLTQVKLASLVGVSQNTISSWLNRKKQPSLTSLWLLADYFDVTIDYLVGKQNF